MSQVLPVAWYRFRTTFARRWGGYLSVVRLIGLVGGIAMASIAGARRTQSSYPTFLASTNPSDMTISVYSPNSGAAVKPLTGAIARLPGVKRVRDVVGPDFVPLAPNGTPRLNTLNDLLVVASSDGGLLDQDRPAIVQGRRAVPDDPNEMMMTASVAGLLGVHIGEVVPMGFYTNVQEALPAFGTPRLAPRVGAPMARSSVIARRAESTGMPVAAVVGIRFALEPGRGRTAVPVRAALVGTVVAVALVVSTLTFASSLNTLVSHPALYGWNWDYALNPSNDVPPRALELLSRDHDVAEWSGFDYSDVAIDDQTVPVLMALAPTEVVSPPVLSGHGLEASNQVVMGAATLDVLHKKVGETVFLSYGTAADAPIYVPPTALTIVGTATFPAVGFESLVADHTSMGTGAMISEAIFPPAFQRAVETRDANLNGPELVFVRLRHGVSPVAGRADLERIADAADKVLAADPHSSGQNVTVLGVQRPAQIVNYHSIGSTPVILAVGLAVGAIVALGLTLAASVRRRRRDLALLKTLGFTQRQLAAAVAWQATVAAITGVIVGIPLGIVIGRELWTLFAHNLNAVPDPSVPAIPVTIVAVEALVFANLVAALPGRSAARTPTVLVLRAE